MPPALDRLLVSPSALRLLRSIVNAPELPAACSTAANCCPSKTSRRTYSNSPKPSVQQKWRRWQDATTKEETARRETVRRFLEAEDRDHGTLSTGADKANDEAAWAVTLARQERVSRLPGIRAVWRSLRHQGHHLPTAETPDADFLWGTFIKNPLLVEKVIDHASELLQKTGNTYPRLYDLILGYWLSREPRKALSYHHQMLVKLNLRKLPLRQLAHLGRTTFSPAAWEALMDIYRNSNERNLYDETVPPLIEQGNINMARRWHALCTSRGDLPSESAASHPVVHIFTAEMSNISTPKMRFNTKPTSKNPKRNAGGYNKELMQRLLGRDTAPVRFEDSFCARLFATRTFPPESIMQGLALVGVNEIGPLAVLAMAARTQPIEELPRRFEELRAAGIALQGCVFSLALEKFAMEQKWQLVHSMLNSDQHPDVFGLAKVQRKLLEYYLDQGDLVQAQRTLAILTLFHNDSSAESWNLLLQVYIKRSGPRHVMEVLQDMRSRGVMLSFESIMAIKDLLRQRRPGHKPGVSTRGRFDDLRFVTRVFMSILESGMGAIGPTEWREIIRRFGMLGRFRELRRLLLWLLCWYAPRSSRQFASLPESPFLKPATAKLRAAYPERHHYFHFPTTITQRENVLHPIRLLFTPSLQQGLITWGFRAGLLPNAHLEQSMFGSTLEKKHYRQRLLRSQTLKRLDWSIGLRTVLELRDLGLHLHQHTVVKALQMQFVVLFGRGRSKKKENRMMEDVNTIPYARYIQEVNKICGRMLFREPTLLGKGIPHLRTWHPRLRRNPNRRGSISLNAILGPQWRQQSRTDNESDERAAKDTTALEELQKHFLAQAKAIDPTKDAGTR
ncbi:uncharacterized protein K460DRAFT_375856 [Cucurbitaria berberidis CBS 394.84]|uniref:Pentatricopeptide repeat protein n=1 Tax=Cucurbitaria berberidis CBS 394.84 TaxID=1168544 RepID=A0A9P4LCG9_9PLEO|nr:uncharacterized protein K460DRAFT_375856 [Cucurbitaria berberidis CBS 394.84]KAF1849154.1 hypothetical protein K460DRAFT_375856 [Cucurbitaria berberidis CBS 394.84]